MPLIREPIIRADAIKETTVSYPEYPNFGYSHYVTTILSLDSVRFHFLNRWVKYQSQYTLSLDSEEDLYDWLVNEAFAKVTRLIFDSRVSGHYRHDIYKCVYDDIGFIIENSLIQLIKSHKLHFSKGQRVKTLVAGNSLFIVKGVIPRA